MLTRSRFRSLGEYNNELIPVRQLCLSASLVPQSFIDEMRNPATVPKGMVTDAPAVAVSTMSEERKEVLLAKLRQAISDEEECSASPSFGHTALKMT
jgi:hypothetical protein